MKGSSDLSVVSSVKSKQEIREEIRDYIRNDRDTVLIKWMALKESVHNEDRNRERFYDRKQKFENKRIPENILKFIGSLKRAVRKTMRNKGGTPYSIIRSMFVYWDASKTGEISAKDLHACMQSLSVEISFAQCQEIVDYYDAGRGTHRMNYGELLRDIQQGEPSMIAFVSQKEEEEQDKKELHFKEVGDHFKNKPAIVKRFLEAVRDYVIKKMQTVGGTPQQHIRFLFQFFDYDYSGGLEPHEVVYASKKKMNLNVTKEQAQEIVKFYDRKFTGQMEYEAFVNDISEDVVPVLSFVELTPRRIAKAKKSLATNPFTDKPFHATSNKILEKFKKDIKLALFNKVNKVGGSVSSWVREAFVTWDPYYTKKISDWRNLIGAAKRLGVTISQEEALVLMKCYDRFNDGNMHYMFLAEEVTEDDPHFLAYYTINNEFGKTATTRTPPNVDATLRKIMHAIDKFVTKSKGCVKARSFLLGTCMRFDSGGGFGDQSGHLTLSDVNGVLNELRVTGCSTGDVKATLDWFDTTGSNRLDYKSMLYQLYGADPNIGGNGVGVSTESLLLPLIGGGKGYIPPPAASGAKVNIFKNHVGSNLQSIGLPGPDLNAVLLRSTLPVPPAVGGGPGVGSPTARMIPQSASTRLFKRMSQTLPADSSTEYRSYTTNFTKGEDVFGVSVPVKLKNLEVIEKPSVALARQKLTRTKILHEKQTIQRKIKELDDQRKKIIDEYKSKKGKG